jgi:hypothetical protein
VPRARILPPARRLARITAANVSVSITCSYLGFVKI